VDTNWYTDTGATDHITSELDKLTVKNKYHGGDQIHIASSSGMGISHIGHSTVHTPSRDIHLKNVLYVPQAKKNLVSVHRLAADNSASLEFHPDVFFIKDQATKNILLKGWCHNGLYPLPSPLIKHAHGATRSSMSQWHSRLGHPSSSVVKQVISSNNLPYLDEPSDKTVCDACQQGKSHQLPYPKSSSVPKFPLELVFSDVWGAAPESVGRKKYYVSFIDNFSKFTWIYLLRFKSEVFQKFQEFQTLVERLFDRKIISVQTDWGGEYRSLHSFFTKLGIDHHVSCPHAHQQNGNIVTSLKSVSLSWPMRLCLSNFGMKHSCRQLILLIVYLVELLVTLPPLNAFLIKSLITQPCEYLGVHAGQISDHTILTNFSSVQNNVFSLATVHSIKATSA